MNWQNITQAGIITSFTIIVVHLFFSDIDIILKQLSTSFIALSIVILVGAIEEYKNDL